MVVGAPARVGHNLARLLEGDGGVIVPPHCDRVYDCRPRERLVLPVEVADKRQVHGRLARAVEVDAHVPLLGCRRPGSPDAARAFHLGEDQLAILFADDAVAVAVGVPADVFLPRRVIATCAVIARPLHALLAWRRQHGQVFQIGQPFDQVNVGEFLLRGSRRATEDYRAKDEHTNDRVVLASHKMTLEYRFSSAMKSPFFP